MNNSTIKKTKSLIRTKTANFGDKPDMGDDVATDNGDKCIKKLNFRKEVDVIHIKSTIEEFNIQVSNEKSEEKCTSCKKCIIF
jgi:hypothetical protein